MDNLTHSLAGLIVADAALALRRRHGSAVSPHYPAAAFTVSLLANNAPDFDFLYVGITSGKLGYLLHHRGHTHTLAAVPLLALLTVALVALGLRLRGRALARADVVELGALGLAGGVLHVSMDFGNNYGVHPFWPLYDGWFYGDAIFIIEPWLLIVLIGMALGIGASRAFRGALLIALFAVLALAWTVRLASAQLAAALTVFAAIWTTWLWRASYRKRTTFGCLALGVSCLVLLGTRHAVRANVRAALDHGDETGLALVDMVSTPAPGNPLCWSLLTVQLSEREYLVREAVAAPLPALYPASRCRVMNDGQTAPLTPPRGLGAVDASALVWGGEFRGPRSELARMRHNCVARAFLRFARVPYWRDGDRATLIGDLRFDRSSAVEFAELLIVPDAPCPRNEPPWLPPLSID